MVFESRWWVAANKVGQFTGKFLGVGLGVFMTVSGVQVLEATHVDGADCVSGAIINGAERGLWGRETADRVCIGRINVQVWIVWI